MKRVFLSVVAAATLFVGCNADAEIEVLRPIKVDAPTFSASFDDQTRTSYEEDQGYAKWIENEHLSIFNYDNHNLKYYIHNVGNNGKTADMDYAEEYVEKSGDILDQNYAIYPYSEANEAANGVIYSEIPAVQTFDAESNFKNVPIVACSPDTSLSFSIPTAIYRYKVKKQNHPSKFYLKSITMTSASRNIAGAIEIDMTAEKPVAVVTGDGKSVTLDLGENGVEITTTEQYFYIALPAISFPENDRTITCLVSKGGKDYQVVIEKNNVMDLEAGVVKSTSIELKATSFTANSVYPSSGGELVGSLTLTSDFTLTQPLTVPAGEEATLNLNGHSITNNVENTELSYFDILYVEEGAKLTINGNGNVEAASGIEGYCVFAEGDVIINGGSYKAGRDADDLTNACIYARGNGNITINGGEFESADGQYVLNLKDSDRSTASITVKGGKFHNFDPANNASEGAGTNFVAEGYISVETSEGVWEVVPANEPIEVATAAALEDVLAQGGEATLAANINLENTAIVITEGEATINLNGKTITGGLFAESSGAITEGDSDSYAFWVKEGAKLTINGEGEVKTDACKYSMAVWAQGGEVVINGGYYENAGEGSDLIYASAGGKVTINDGEFNPCKKQAGVDGTADMYTALNLKDNTGSQIIVNGGKFHNFDPANNASEGEGTNFVAEGYISVETSENVWEVVPANEPVEVATATALEDVLAQGASAVLTADITANGAITIPATATSTIDLNGKTLDYSAATMGEALITNRGNLTIKGQGEVAYTYTGEADSAYSKGNYTISNCGTLTIDGATISNNTAKMSHAYYAIDNNSNNTPATLTINSGKVVNTTSYAIRQIANKDNSITVNGGEVEGTRAFWIQLPGSNTAVAPNATLNVNGGTLNATGETGYKLAVYSYNYGNDPKNVKINITDGVVNGDIALTGGKNKTNIESVNISGGTINGDVYSYGEDALAAEAINITGGTISNNTLYVLPYVGSNAEQLNIKMSEDMVAESSIVIPASATVILDLNGKSISQENAQTATYAMIENKGTLTIKDSVGGGKVSYADTTVYTADVNYASNTISNKGTLTIESGIIENISSDNVMTYGYPHAIDVYQGSVTNINGGTVKSANYDCIRMFCNSTTVATTVNISGGNIINRVSFQNPSNNQAGYGRLNITGGTFTSTVGKANVRLLNFSTDVSNMKAEITGGTFDNGVSISNYSSSWTANWDWLTIGDGVTINKL